MERPTVREAGYFGNLDRILVAGPKSFIVLEHGEIPRGSFVGAWTILRSVTRSPTPTISFVW